MYLKSIEIHGFKSFANKIKFDFHNGITGIVGPNGSGKSNVADAVRWVLGEQKIKQLRGSKMEDVIFAGTENRKPMGYSYVAIVFDNSDHKLNLDYKEVTVSRRLYRSGESEYMINGTQVRLKDVNELFYDTGIGKEGYSIIGQGQIDKILSGKPEERRELFDEAAGIVKFKRRKNEALKKLDDQNQNLVRVSDILSELERQVIPLEKQSAKAKRYLELKEDLKTNDVNMFLIEMEEIKSKLGTIDEKIKIAESDMDVATNEFEEIKENYKKLEEVIETININVENKKEKLNETNLLIEKAEGQINVINEQINSAKSSESYMSERITNVVGDIEKNEDELKNISTQKDDNENKLKELTTKQSELSLKVDKLTDEYNNLSAEIEKDKEEIINIMNAKANIQSKLQRWDAMLEQINLRKDELKKKLNEFQTRKDDQDNLVKSLTAQLEESEKEIKEVTVSLNDANQNLADLRVENSKLAKDLSKNQENYHKAKSNLDTLKNITERYEGYGHSIKKIMELKKQKKGIIGVVADIIKVDKKYEVAIETALGGNIQNVVTDTETTAKETIEYLKKNKFGRATFLPLSSMSDKTNFNAPSALEEKGVIGLASDLIDIKKEYSGVTKYLLGRVMVVDTIDNAIKIERKYKYTVRIVTLEGEYLNVGGSISGGAFKNTSNLLGRRREIDDLEKKIDNLYVEKKDLDKKITDNNASISATTDEIRKINAALQEQKLVKNTIEVNLDQAKTDRDNLTNEYEGLGKEQDNISDQIENINDNSEKLSNELSGNKDRSDELEKIVMEKNDRLGNILKDRQDARADLETVNIEIANVKQKHDFISDNINRLKQLVDSLKSDLEELTSNSSVNNSEIEARMEAIEKLTAQVAEYKEYILTLNDEIAELNNEKERQSNEHKDFFEKRESLSEKISSLDKEIYRLKSQKDGLVEKSENKETYMWEEYELTPRGALELKSEDCGDKASIREALINVRKEMKSLGDVNINAIEEFKEVNDRYQFMKSQHDDLMKAKENLLGVIEELEVGMRKQFKEKFQEIRVEFDKVFKELFGGGKGTIELTDEEEDILEAGINIISQPPGKKLQNMMQLSGGEKALTAISLLFAIQNLKPSPFCLLDEIEAALDGSNVVRFAEYLHKLTKNTQFIVITHRRGTMGCADRLYGITMQEKGVSALVSVDLLDKDLDKE